MKNFAACVFAVASTATACFGIASKEGGFEYAIDAPWRIEPRQLERCAAVRAECPARYRIPIQISLHDMHHQMRDVYLGSPLNTNAYKMANFVRVEVSEGGASPRIYLLRDLHEVEYTATPWPWPVPVGYTPDHHLCKVWAGEPCTGFEHIDGKSEWHATLFYEPQATSGSAAQLTVTARISQPGTDRDVKLENHLRVFLAPDVLPRFGENWLYGDLHYHSQGTNNDAESAYSYRGVSHAMAAMGLDFLFATDHASNSKKIIDIETLPPSTDWSGLRDMSERRFAYNLGWLTDPGGVNAEVLPSAWHGLRFNRAPQIYLGGEVDAIPEMRDLLGDHVLRYGINGAFNVGSICDDVPGWLAWVIDHFTDCSASSFLDATGDEAFRYKISDIQGFGSAYARQHFVHLPTDGSRDDAFVSSSTSSYGGATRRLKDILATDYATNPKGYFFLAHPIDTAQGKGDDRFGPDILAYSDAQLETVFASPSFLGLQLWNSDTRLKTEDPEATGYVDGLLNAHYVLNPWKGVPGQWQDTVDHLEAAGKSSHGLKYQLHQGAYMWDRMLLWGMDTFKTAGLSWLEPGLPRRVFMAGGSDAHGDLNYRQEGAFFGISAVTDTAIGKPRNLVFVPPSRSPNQQQNLTTALASGQFSVTDGPALRIVLDVNRNGQVDPTDIPMGATAGLSSSQGIPLLVEWKSTAEFGRVASVDLYVGATSSDVSGGTVYAPRDHGVRSIYDPPSGTKSFYNIDGVRYEEMWDKYFLDPTGMLHIAIGPGEAFEGHRLVEIPGDRFPALIEDSIEQGMSRNKHNASRLYVRAFARTQPGQSVSGAGCSEVRECLPRYAFTNPIWINRIFTAVPVFTK